MCTVEIMSEASSIEWTDSTWNPVTGCTKVSQGCKHCYAQRFAERFRGVEGHPFEQGFDLRLWPERLELPLAWKEPRRIFVNSMSDLYHPGVPKAFIDRVFRTMRQARWHSFQILTKRAERLAEIGVALPWSPNIWQGVSVEDGRVVARIGLLRYSSRAGSVLIVGASNWPLGRPRPYRNPLGHRGR